MYIAWYATVRQRPKRNSSPTYHGGKLGAVNHSNDRRRSVWVAYWARRTPIKTAQASATLINRIQGIASAPTTARPGPDVVDV